MNIFISYSHKDKFAAKIFELWLKESDLTPLRDETHFKPGKLHDEILKNIKRCDLLLAVLSSNYYSSEFTQAELGQAEALNREILFVSIDKTDSPQGLHRQHIPLKFIHMPPEYWKDIFVSSIMEKKVQIDLNEDSLYKAIHERKPNLSNPELQEVVELVVKKLADTLKNNDFLQSLDDNEKEQLENSILEDSIKNK